MAGKSNILIIAILFCFLSRAAVAQNEFRRSLDSLQHLLTQNPPDSTKAKIFVGLSWAYRGLDSVKVFHYANEAIKLHKKAKNTKGIAVATYALAYAYLNYENIAKAGDLFHKTYRMIEGDTSLKAAQIRNRVLGSLAYIEGIKGFPQKEVDLLLKIIPDLERIRDSAALGVTYHNVGIKFVNLKEHNKAYPYLIKSIDYLNKTEYKSSLGVTYLSLGSCLLNLDSLSRSHYYLELAKSSFQNTNDADEWTLYYTYYGQFLHASQMPREALKAFKKAMELAKAKKHWYRMNDIWEGIFIASNSIGDYSASRNAMNEYYQSNLDRKVLANQLTGLKNLSFVEEKLGNINSAYNYLKSYHQLRDSVESVNTQARINELVQRYHATEKEKQILELKNTTKQQQLDIQQSKFITYLLVGGITALLLSMALIFKLYQHKSHVAKQKELLHVQKLKELEQEKQLGIYSAMLEGQEQERKRLARDIHDGLGGALAGIKLQLSKMSESAQPVDSGDLQKTIGQLDHSISDLRSIARNLMPESLLRLGLEASLKDLCESMQNSNTKIVFQAYNLDRSIPETTQLMIYRILQELINNAIKYAEAEQVLVQCIQENNKLQITVEDDGTGFTTKVPSKGIGLTSVRNRVDFLKGHLDINSEIGVGTTVNIEIELKQEEWFPVEVTAVSQESNSLISIG